MVRGCPLVDLSLITGCVYSAKMPAVFWWILSATISQTVASCNIEQQQSCRKAAVEDNLELLASGGQCMVKQYVQFTHICTVVDYLPSTDSCCCVHENLVLCCRYHQGWKHFRCVETEDTVHHIQVDVSSIRLELLVPLVLLAVLLVFVVVLCTCKHSRFSRNGNRTGCISRCCSAPEVESGKPPVTNCLPDVNDVQLRTTTRDIHLDSQAPIPKSRTSMTEEETSQTVLIPLTSNGVLGRKQPSAPPVQELLSDYLCQDCHLSNDSSSGVEYYFRNQPTSEDGATSAFLLIGTRPRSNITNTPELTGECNDRTSANFELYMALNHPPTYEEATRLAEGLNGLRWQRSQDDQQGN